MESFAVLLLLIVTAFGGEVLQDPVSQVQLWGQNATFVCSGKGETNDLFFILNDGSNHVAESSDETLNSNGIFWEMPPPEAEIKTWTVTILANSFSNNTQLYCKFEGSDPTAFTDSAFLIVVNDTPPVNFGGLHVTFVNTTLLSLMYDKPWDHPVNKYSIFIKNVSSGLTSMHNIGSTSFSLTQPSFYAVDALEIFVIAQTDLGNSTSNSITTSFAKEFPDSLGPIDVNIRNASHIDVNFTKPEVSMYQSMKYNYTLLNMHTNEATTLGPYIYNGSIAPIKGGIEKDSQYQLTVTLWFEPGSGAYITADKKFNTTILSNEPATTPVVTSTSTSTATSILPTGTTTTEGPTKGNELILILSVVGGVGGAILILVCVSVVLLVVFLLRTHKRLAVRIDAIEDTEKGKPGGDHKCHRNNGTNRAGTVNPDKLKMPKVMATNPIYDGNSAMYECLPESRDLKGFTSTSSLPPPSSLDLYLEIPPAVPPPRKMSMDSPGVKSGAQFSLNKTMGAVQESVDHHHDPDNEEYVKMLSRCALRYTKSPVLREGVSEQLAITRKDDSNSNNKDEKKN